MKPPSNRPKIRLVTQFVRVVHHVFCFGDNQFTEIKSCVMFQDLKMPLVARSMK